MAPVQSVSIVPNYRVSSFEVRHLLVARIVPPVRSVSSIRQVFCVEIRAKHELNRKLRFLEHLKALRIAPGLRCRLGAIHRSAYK